MGREIKKKLNMYQRDQMHIFSSLPISIYSFISLGRINSLKIKERNRYFIREVKTQDILLHKAFIITKKEL